MAGTTTATRTTGTTSGNNRRTVIMSRTETTSLPVGRSGALREGKEHIMFTRKGIVAALVGAVGIAGLPWLDQAEAGPKRVQRAWRNYVKEVHKDPCDDDVAKKWNKFVRAQQESGPIVFVTPGVATTTAPVVVQPQAPAMVPETAPPASAQPLGREPPPRPAPLRGATPDRGSRPEPAAQPRDVRRDDHAAPPPSVEKEPPPVPKEPEAEDREESSPDAR